MAGLSPAERYARSRARAASPFLRFCDAQDLEPDPFQISAADQWPASLEHGISRLKAFQRLFLHPLSTPLA